MEFKVGYMMLLEWAWIHLF